MVSNVRVAPIETPARLTERTKSQAVGNFLISSVVGSVAGSTGNAGNMQQMQANMEISRAFSENLSRTLPQNYAVESGRGVDLALAKKMSDYFDASTGALPKTQELYISVSAPLWELGYTSFLTSEDYNLSYGLNLNVQEKLNDQLNPVTAISCSGVAKETMPLEAWQADDYKNVNVAAEAIVNKCFTQFMTAMGLPVIDKSIDGSNQAQLQKTQAP
ncbi:hypothetical protein GCM10011430_08720 [Oxalicibacterium solurbis]|uniref:Uncharacterized protein n=2 Tax=Oxalicibacterium solurbis TaxID=69280 RepID=A0A8J3F5L0_9BURK|nr:hypothetical protein GCM10011430_08720 [Oxalicibacterium solurbis]